MSRQFSKTVAARLGQRGARYMDDRSAGAISGTLGHEGAAAGRALRGRGRRGDGKVHVFGGSVLGFTGLYHRRIRSGDRPNDPARRFRHTRSRRLGGLERQDLHRRRLRRGRGRKGRPGHRLRIRPGPQHLAHSRPHEAGRGSVSVVALDGKLHAIGGRGADGITVATHEVYDPATNTWTERRRSPRRATTQAATAIDGKIYFAGGRFGASTDSHQLARRLRFADQYLDLRPAVPRSQRARRNALQGVFLVLGGEAPGANDHQLPRTRPSTSRPTPGSRSRRCRPAATRPCGGDGREGTCLWAGGSLPGGAGTPTN